VKTWTLIKNIPLTYAAKRMVPDEDVNIEPVDYVWPLKTAVELCSPKKVGGKFEVVGGAGWAEYMEAKIIIC
jgi:hypothetical protein